jgi:hypothetical protein
MCTETKCAGSAISRRRCSMYARVAADGASNIQRVTMLRGAQPLRASGRHTATVRRLFRFRERAV